MSERITDARDLKFGDVVQVAVELTDKQTGKRFWWRRFCVVTEKAQGWANKSVMTMTLKMNPEPKDFRVIELEDVVVTLVPERQWPQGVSAMYMKHLATGLIKVAKD